VGKKGGKDEDNDDPIEKSLNERIAAGGLNSVVKSAESGKVSKSLGKAIEKKVKDKVVQEEEKGGETPKNKPPGKLMQAIEKNVASKVDKIKKQGKDDDTDDPIAQAFKLREKFGGPTQQVPAAEAKKLGLIKTT
jgi:hypothetical protein